MKRGTWTRIDSKISRKDGATNQKRLMKTYNSLKSKRFGKSRPHSFREIEIFIKKEIGTLRHIRYSSEALGK